MSEQQDIKLKVGELVEAEVFKVTSFGAFVKLTNGQRALIHISQVADSFVKNISDHLKLGDKMKARVLNID
ncbi:S1 RNA-binding domain-containing protein, partial [Candidatus Omnitrophota bacterium]